MEDEKQRATFLESQFIEWLRLMMSENPTFSNVYSGVDSHPAERGRKGRVDLVFRYGNSPYIAETKRLAPLTQERVTANIEQLKKYRNLDPFARLVLIVPDAVAEEYIKMFMDENIEVWDTPVLAHIFSSQLPLIKDTALYELLFQASQPGPRRPTTEDDLIKKLRNTPKGRQSWSDYQQLVAEILSYLFVPPLSRPYLEYPDFTRVNRRDMIFPNYAEEKFWLFAREQYKADFVVVDAKNHTSSISKRHVLQMSNYLRDFGAGLFGIICCRTQAANDSIVTCREQWVAYQKLILFLNDDDLIQMLTSKKNAQEPEEVIRQKIADFRLGM